MSPMEFPEVDLSHGIVGGGRLTRADIRAAEALRAAAANSPSPNPSKRRSWSVMLWLILVALASFYYSVSLDPAPRGGIVEPPPEQVETSRNEKFLQLLAAMSGIVVAILPVCIVIKLGRKKRDAADNLPWHELLFQEEVFYSASLDSMLQHRWTGLVIHESNDLLVLENVGGTMEVIPRRFAPDETTWNELRSLVHRMVPTATGAKPVATLNPPAVPQEQPIERVDALEAWARFPLKSPVVGQSTGAIDGAEVASQFIGWRKQPRIVIALVAPLLAGVVGVLTMTKGLGRVFFVAVVVVDALLLLLAAWLFRRGRRNYQSLFAKNADMTTVVCESYVLQHGQNARSFYRWSSLRRRPSSDDFLMLKIGESELTLPLVKRMFPPTAWSRIWARAASLPLVDS